jgi:hypothetical protein
VNLKESRKEEQSKCFVVTAAAEQLGACGKHLDLYKYAKKWCWGWGGGLRQNYFL